MATTHSAIIVIPARYQSSRFPGKPLALIKGISMIERVYRIASQCQSAHAVYIATDSEEIAQQAESFGAKVLMTSQACLTGTDRVAEAAAALNASEETILVSLQGDAVLTPPWVIDELITAMHTKPHLPIATPAVQLVGQAITQFLNHKEISPTSGTTVTFDKNGKALYFSKQPIPYLYDPHSSTVALHRHIGLYAYRYKTLKILQALPPSSLEKMEKLEQLRALENGIDIQVVCVDYRGRSHGSVDTKQDVQLIEKIIEKEGELVA